MSALVLVADEDPFNLRLLQQVCEEAGYRVVTADRGGEVLDLVARQRPDVIVLDAALRDFDGFEVLRVLKSDPSLSRVPVLMVIHGEDVDARGRAIALGAEDYVTKPYLVFEVQQRVRNTLRIAETVALRAKRSDLPPLEADEATGAGTARQLAIGLEYEYMRAARYRHPLTCIVLRVSNYDAVVAAEGETTAQRLMGRFASELRASLRRVDQLYRSEPAELTLVLPETDHDGAEVVLARLQRIASSGTFALAVDAPPQIDIGASSWPAREAADGESLHRLARRALG